MDRHIIYKSRGDQMFDDFLFDVLYPWIGTHFLYILGGIAILIMLYCIWASFNSKPKRRKAW